MSLAPPRRGTRSSPGPAEAAATGPGEAPAAAAAEPAATLTEATTAGPGEATGDPGTARTPGTARELDHALHDAVPGRHARSDLRLAQSGGADGHVDTDVLAVLDLGDGRLAARRAVRDQIGRASCRE